MLRIRDYADFIDMVDVHLLALSTCTLKGDTVGADKAEARLEMLYSDYPTYYARMKMYSNY